MPEQNARPRALSDIVNDLCGAPATPASPAPAAPTAPRKAYQSTFPPFEQLWKTADETVDWTDALASATPTDGLTSPRLWSFFHEHAAAVLKGDLNAYVEVLHAANPLGDLAPYAVSFDVEAESADRLRVTFEGSPAYLGAAEKEVRRYLAGVALRAARDLMALLPVRAVLAEGASQGKTLLSVEFDRDELQKVRFSFIDPEAFAMACGGVFCA